MGTTYFNNDGSHLSCLGDTSCLNPYQNKELRVHDSIDPVYHSLKKDRCRYDDHNYVWFSEPFKCTYCYLTRKFGLMCFKCDTYQCFDCHESDDFTFNTHFCPKKHKLRNCRELKECNRCLAYNDGYECIACKYFICTSKICRQFNSTEVKDLPILKGVIYSFNGHTDGVNCIIIFKNIMLVSASIDKTIKIWDINNAECLRTLIGHEGSVIAIFNYDDEKIISSSEDKTVKLWNIIDGICVTTMNTSYIINSFSFTSTSDRLLATTESSLIIYNYYNLKLINTLNLHGGKKINTVVYDNTISHFYTGGDDCLICITDSTSYEKKCLLQGHTGLINKIIILKENKLASCGTDYTIRIWDVNSKKCLFVLLEHTNSVNSIIQENDSQLISCSSDETLKVWDMKKWRCMKTINGHADKVTSLVEFTGFKFISSSNDRSIKVWFA